MKSLKKLVMGATVALTLAGVAHASTELFMVGSTAFRAATTAAIMKALGSTDYSVTSGTGSIPSGTTGDSYAYGYTSSAASLNVGGATNQLFIGQISGSDVIIHTTWTGSEAGIYTIAYASNSGTTVSFIAKNATTLTTGTYGASATGTSSVPDIAMSDTYQANSQFAGGNTVNVFASDGVTQTATNVLMGTLTPVSGDPVGVTYFAFAVSKSGTANINNITTAQFKSLAKTGSLPVAFFNPAYSGSGAVYLMGRNPDSGTRLSTFGETGVGMLGAAQQYFPYDINSTWLNGAGTINYIALTGTPAVVNGVVVAQGNNGYSSGGNLVAALNSENGGTILLGGTTGSAWNAGSCLLAYAGISDLGGNGTTGANGSKFTNGGQIIKFNGIAYNDANVENGTYPLWTYEHMYVRSGYSGGKKTIIDGIVSQINGAGVAGCITRASMNVKRNTGSKDGGSLILSGTF